MGAKKKISHEGRIERRMRAIRNRTNKALAELGVDVKSVPVDDLDAVRQAEDNVRKLRSIASKMNARRSPTEPTDERLHQSSVKPRDIEVRVDQPRAYQFDWIVDTIRDRLSRRQYEAAERLRDSFLAMQPRSAVASMDGSVGASDPTGRLAITEAQEIAMREFAWITERIEPIFLAAIDAFVLEKAPEGSERCPTIAEYGSKVSKFAGENQGRAAGVMAIKMACARLAALWWAYDGEQRERCVKTDRLMRSDLGRRAGADGWICALWDWCRANERLPQNQGEVDQVRAIHNARAMDLRKAIPSEVRRHERKHNRLMAVAFREFEDKRARVA